MKNRLVKLLVIVSITFGSITAANAGEPFLGEIRAVGFNFCPRGWAKADGQLMAISSHSALFSLYGTMYGGDGRTTFALPDLRGRAPIHEGNGPGLPPIAQGQKGGSASFTLTAAQLPNHNHSYAVKLTVAKGRATTTEATDNYIAEAGIFRTGTSQGTALSANLATGNTFNTGGSQQVIKRSPFLGILYCVATVGVFPSR